LPPASAVPANFKTNPTQIKTEDQPKVKAYCARLGQIMWENVGIVRTMTGLKEAKKLIEKTPSKDFRIEHRKKVCYKIIEACLNRPASLGAHYITTDL
ncbi:MAG: hypothetical protein V1760_01010, partial [Candidatus Peregrinibacteria bacterium]